MSILDWIVSSYCILFCVAWCASFLVVLLFRRIRIFEKTKSPLPGEWPRLSVVIATCNDADTIEKAVNTLLQQDYPKLEIVVVNDRSTDKTGVIIEKIARKDSRVRTVHIQHLPPGWLGKVHALHVGTQKTSGEWILYTDADVYFKQGTLRKAIAFISADHSDHLALMPVPRAPSFWLRKLTLALLLPGTSTINIAFIGIIRIVNDSAAFGLVRACTGNGTSTTHEWDVVANNVAALAVARHVAIKHQAVHGDGAVKVVALARFAIVHGRYICHHSEGAATRAVARGLLALKARLNLIACQ